MTYFNKIRITASALILASAGLYTTAANSDIVQADDVIVQFSLCVGNDCVNGESFGFDTVRLKENNLRIHFNDTSTSASFPTNDWRIVINDTSNGGANYFAIQDADTSRIPFRVEAGAPANALYVEADGDIGIKTSNPVVDLHIVEGNTPTVRLEQDGSDGFTPQTYDVASNEANFFIRDVTNGSKLFFRSEPNAPANSVYIESDGDIGMGLTNPTGALHVKRNKDEVLTLEGENGPYITLKDNTHNDTWFIVSQNTNDGDLEFVTFADQANATLNMSIKRDGDVEIRGGLITTGGGGACTAADPCDNVFDRSLYTVPSIEEHAEEMWEKKHLPAVGPTSADEPINMTVKMLRMLNELEKAHIYIEQLNDRIEKLEEQVQDQ